MLSSRPTLQSFEDLVIYVSKRLTRLDIAVKIAPTPNTGINAIDHLIRTSTDEAFHITPDLIEQVVNALF